MIGLANAADLATLAAMDLIPAIDLIAGQVVRLQQGDYARQTTYDATPEGQARQCEQAGAGWLHVVDLDGARSGTPANLEVIRRVCRAVSTMKVEVGGGVRDRGTVDTLLDAGVSRVILGTAALRNWTWFERLAGESDLAGKLVLGLDARGGKLAVSGWEEQVEATAVDVAGRVRGWPLAAIIYTDIATDGTLAGPNLPATAEMVASTDVPVIASGGVGTLDHLHQLRQIDGLAGIIVGRALYEGAFTVDEAIEIVQG
jgi:phosphoribosylformimino-5-aminoimidazole carboxamide ribotide isomerase